MATGDDDGVDDDDDHDGVDDHDADDDDDHLHVACYLETPGSPITPRCACNMLPRAKQSKGKKSRGKQLKAKQRQIKANQTLTPRLSHVILERRRGW